LESEEDAARVLRRFGWDLSRAQDEWFARNDEVRAAVGLALPGEAAGSDGANNNSGGGGKGGGKGAKPSAAAPVRCAICFEDHPPQDTRAAACGHPFCVPCWTGYAAAAVQSGPAAALDLRCPLPKCGAAAPGALLRSVLSEEDRARYDEYGLRSFVEDSPSMAWCPGAGCECAAERLVAYASVAAAAAMPASGGAAAAADAAAGSSGGGGGGGGGGKKAPASGRTRSSSSSPKAAAAAAADNLDPTAAALAAIDEQSARPPRGAAPLPDEAPPLDVLCQPPPPARGCGATFCFTCGEEAHRPVACSTVRAWLTKNSAESENLNWILANTKPCPKCHRPIEKNQGCMHMTCSQCRHEFCWLCSGAWAEHGERTGGFYSCNRFEAARRGGGTGAGGSGGGGGAAAGGGAAGAATQVDADARRREHARASLSRYMHYYERFDAHNRARLAARRDAARLAGGDALEQLADLTRTPTSQLRFVADAWHQVGECRRVLKWTYAYGYYAFEGEGDARWDPEGNLGRSRQFFEFLQGDAERSLDQLHEVVEMRLAALREAALAAGGGGASGGGAGGGSGGGAGGGGDGGGASASQQQPGIPAEAFAEFRRRLVGLTDVTRSFFEKLVAQLERGFGGMGEEYAGGLLVEEDDEGGAGGGGKSGARAEAAAKAAAAAAKSGGGAGAQDAAAPGTWRCAYCTLANSNMSARACEMCGLPRGGDGSGGGGGGGGGGRGR
jgi:hypothetical protein